MEWAAYVLGSCCFRKGGEGGLQRRPLSRERGSLFSSRSGHLFASMMMLGFPLKLRRQIGLKRLGAMINDPFGEDVLDFPLHAYIEELKDDIMCFEACGIANPSVVETPASASAKV